jgi:hypothetical protein
MSHSHRSQFSRAEVARIKLLLTEIRRSDRDRQKALRAQLRRMGFYITDHATDRLDSLHRMSID